MSELSMVESNRRAFDLAAARIPERFENSRGHNMVVVQAMLDHLDWIPQHDVLCIGCGAGQELQLVTGRGAASLVGIDISQQMLRHARTRGVHADLICADAGEWDFGEQRFEVVCASMSLQYLPDFDGVLRRLRAALRTGGRLVFSLPHPAYFAAERTEDWCPEWWPLPPMRTGDYLTERLVTGPIAKDADVQFWLRPPGRVVQALIEAGYEIVSFDEPRPREPVASDDPLTERFLTHLRRTPLIMAGAARRRG